MAVKCSTGQSVRQRKQEKTIENIVKAATKLFAKNGFERTSTESIAKEAGVSQGIIFHHFKTKKNLFWSIVFKGSEMSAEELRAYNAEISRTENPIDKIKVFGKVLIKYALDNPELTEIRARHAFAMDLSNEPEIVAKMEESVAPLESYFREGKEKGVFREDFDVKIAMYSFFGVFNFNYTIWETMSSSDELESIIAKAFDQFIYGLVK